MFSCGGTSGRSGIISEETQEIWRRLGEDTSKILKLEARLYGDEELGIPSILEEREADRKEMEKLRAEMSALSIAVATLDTKLRTLQRQNIDAMDRVAERIEELWRQSTGTNESILRELAKLNVNLSSSRSNGRKPR